MYARANLFGSGSSGLGENVVIRHLIAVFCLLTALTARAEVIDIDNVELAKLTSSGVPLIDVRTASEWEETGIVPGSHLLTFFDERGKSDPAAWLEKLKAVAKPGAPLVLICRSGNRSKTVGQFLAQHGGYAKIYNAKSGIRAWAAEGRTVISAAPVLASCRAAKIC